jgi:hypothetical protein
VSRKPKILYLQLKTVSFWTSNFSCNREHCNVLTTKFAVAGHKNGAYDDVTAGPGIMSEINTGNSVDPMMPPNNAGGM